MQESIPGKPTLTESQAQEELDALLENPAHRFLTENPANRERIENAETAKEALAFAKDRIRQRIEASTTFNGLRTIEGIEIEELSAEGLQATVETVWKNRQSIGQGGDAVVVIFKNEIRRIPPEICYKFATAEKTPRGRNSIQVEAELHEQFYDVATQLDGKIGVPVPFYSLEVGDKKLIAMEKLPAASLEDILRSKGVLPQWLDPDEFCQELKRFIDECHKKHLYHRDMHFGNIMITQKKELNEGEKMGYIIDFGLSGQSEIDEFAYKKEVAGSLFTYNDDYGIISEVNRVLKARIASNRGV